MVAKSSPPSPPHTERVAQLQKQIAEVSGKRWLARKRSTLEAELSELLAQQDEASKDDAPPEKQQQDEQPRQTKRMRKEEDEEEEEEEEDDEENEYDDKVEKTDTAGVADLASEDYCAKCQIPLKLVPHRAVLVCTSCGAFSSYIDSTIASIPYGDGVEVSSMYCYKRFNHYRLQLSQLQATESSEVPQKVIDQIMANLMKRGVTKPQDVSIPMLRQILKELKQRRHYDNLAQIHSRITGIPPFRLTPKIEQQLRLMFLAIQEPFQRHCPADRRNFLSYHYLLAKFFALLGLDELLPYCQMLKGRDKLAKQEAIFRLCCDDLGWTFVPSTR